MRSGWGRANPKRNAFDGNHFHPRSGGEVFTGHYRPCPVPYAHMTTAINQWRIQNKTLSDQLLPALIERGIGAWLWFAGQPAGPEQGGDHR